VRVRLLAVFTLPGGFAHILLVQRETLLVRKNTGAVIAALRKGEVVGVRGEWEVAVTAATISRAAMPASLVESNHTLEAVPLVPRKSCNGRHHVVVSILERIMSQLLQLVIDNLDCSQMEIPDES